MSHNVLLEREQMDEAYKWQLEDIYESNNHWETEYKNAESLLEEVAGYAGKLSESVETFSEALSKYYELSLVVERLFVYARMRRDEDNSNTTYQALADRATSLTVKAQSATSYMTPEILGMEPSLLDQYMEHESIATYRQSLIEILHRRPHTLSKSEEKILAMAGEMAAAPDTIYSMMTDADMTFPTIKDENGNDVEISHGRFIPLMESKDQEVRKAAFEGLYSTYKKWDNTMAASLSSTVKKDIFFAKARNYDSALKASLHPDNVPQEVYDSLIEAIHDSLPSMHRYMRLKKKMLGVEELHMYDLYVPVVDDVEMKISYEEAVDMIGDGLKPLGEEYIKIMIDGVKNNKWVDVYENKGKTSGAYSWGIWGTHPYVLMNWNDTVDNAFTLAHELGHAMHTHYSDSTQPYHLSGYPLILAEVASTCNEALFMDFMLGKTQGKKERMFLLNYFLEQFRTTVYRQVMFAEFEKITHDMAEQGKSLTSEALQDVYRRLNEEYYGDDMVIDDEIAMEWARIPHFYRAFYVYKYATGFASAIALSRMVLRGGEKERERYLNFLKGGCTKFPLELLKDAGVDLTTPHAVKEALKTFEEILDELEGMI